MLAIFMTIENDGERRLAEELYLSYRGRMCMASRIRCCITVRTPRTP